MVKRRRTATQSAAPAAHAAVPDTDTAAFLAGYRAMPPEGQALARQFMVVREFAMWRTCPIEACRRAGTCRGPDIDCFRDRRGELKEKILATFARWIDIADISPEEFDLFWEREIRAAGLDVEEDAMA